MPILVSSKKIVTTSNYHCLVWHVNTRWNTSRVSPLMPPEKRWGVLATAAKRCRHASAIWHLRDFFFPPGFGGRTHFTQWRCLTCGCITFQIPRSFFFSTVVSCTTRMLCLQGTQQGMLEGDFALCISLYHGYELLMQMGLRSLFFYIQGIMDGSRGLLNFSTSKLQNVPYQGRCHFLATCCLTSPSFCFRNVPGQEWAAEDSRLYGPLSWDGGKFQEAPWYLPFFFFFFSKHVIHLSIQSSRHPSIF